MISAYTLAATFALLGLAQVRGQSKSDMVIESPPLQLCQNVTISWTGGDPPYNVYLYDMSAPVRGPDKYFEQIGPVDSTSTEWLVNMPVGTDVGINVRDAEFPNFDGSAILKSVLTIKDSGDDSCVNPGPSGDSGQPLTTDALGTSSTESAATTSSAAVSTASEASATPSDSDSGNGALSSLQAGKLWMAVSALGVWVVYL